MKGDCGGGYQDMMTYFFITQDNLEQGIPVGKGRGIIRGRFRLGWVGFFKDRSSLA